MNTADPTKKILFVCESNAVRSPYAAALFNALSQSAGLRGQLQAFSRGSFCGPIQRQADRRIREVASSKGFSLESHTSKDFRAEELP